MKPKAGSAAAKTGKLDLTLTPEAKELNEDFVKNKGKLPWPVEKGVITSRFGKQAHPVIAGIQIDNRHRYIRRSAPLTGPVRRGEQT